MPGPGPPQGESCVGLCPHMTPVSQSEDRSLRCGPMIAQQTRSGAMQGIMYGVLVSAKPVTKVTDRITKKMEYIFFAIFPF